MNPLNLKVEEIAGLYSYIELLCFKPIVANLREYYKKPIEENLAEIISKSFEDNNFQIITKISLATACRKLISRYLVSIRDDTDYNENNKLDLYLNRDEVWNNSIWNEKQKFEKDLDKIRKFELTLGQCYELYNLLGGDEQEAYKGIVIKDDEDKDNVNIKQNEDVNQKILKRNRDRRKIRF